jgi:hypothetical protein
MLLTAMQALLGFNKTITHLDGNVFDVSREDVTQPGLIVCLLLMAFKLMLSQGLFKQSKERGCLAWSTVRDTETSLSSTMWSSRTPSLKTSAQVALFWLLTKLF